MQIGILGFGTVGTGVVKLLLENRDVLEAHVDTPLTLKRIADIDTTRDRGLRPPEGMLIPDGHTIVDDPEIDVVVELIGGETIAKTLILRAIDNGKHVVTANKALLASHGNELFAAARKKGVELAYEAAVGGCMPVIKTLRESLVGNRISSMKGILNGTCNYILTQMTEEKKTYVDALKEAQEIGYAEADPTLDVEGWDTAHKLAIVNALAYGMEINLSDIHVEGISGITPIDIEFAEEFGYRIKLLAISKLAGDAVEARVHPAMIPRNSNLAAIGGSLNAFTIAGDLVDEVLLSGHGAGMMPTTSAVISDLVDIARNRKSAFPLRLPHLSYLPRKMKKLTVLPPAELTTQYYFRLTVVDRPGVLSKVSGVLADHDISIMSVKQKGRHALASVPIVVFTHRAKEAAVRNAMAEINALEVVRDRSTLIRIEDENAED